VDNALILFTGQTQRDALTFFNPVAVRITGYSETELIGKHYIELIDPEHRAATTRFYGIQYVKRIPDTYYEYPIQTRERGVVWLGQNVQLILDGIESSDFRPLPGTLRNAGTGKRS